MDRIEGVDVTCLDVCMPVVIARARDLGKTARETAKELDADRSSWRGSSASAARASLAMGMGEAEGRVIPKFAMSPSPPRRAARSLHGTSPRSPAMRHGG
jgi:2-methylaconitate cis-trans-isomerase PrpF